MTQVDVERVSAAPSTRPRARVLCVLPAVPMPTTTGGLMRSLTQLRGLDAHFDLTALALHRAPQDAHALRAQLRGELITVPFPSRHRDALGAELRAFVNGRPLLYGRYASPALARALEVALRSERFDLVHFDHLHTAQLAPLVRKLQPHARIVVDEHNVEAQIVERMVPLTRAHLRLPLAWHARRLRRMESRIVAAADAVLACSALDANHLRELGAQRVRVVPNSAPFDVPPRGDERRRDVVFVGSFDWWPNIDAAMQLAKEIWPRCAERLGDARLMIVGRNPPDALKALASERVIVTGAVESVAPYLHGARAAAVPLRAGSGTRLKIIEAWAYGVPVVSTPIGAEGLPVVDGENGLLADRVEDFCDALVRVFDDAVLAQRLSEGALRTAEAFRPERIGETLASFYRDELLG